MTAADSRGPARHDTDLDGLRRRLRDARLAVAAHRGGPIGSEAARSSRQEMLCALEAYIGELERRCFPVPYALRDELRLAKRISDG